MDRKGLGIIMKVTGRGKVSLNVLSFGTNSLKGLFKFPRKEKKRIMGTGSARNKLSKRIKLGLPFGMKHITRAGLEIK